MRLALSGGGFRATLFHLGVIRYLREKDLLKTVTHIYSVSGGSILAAHLVLNWDKYCLGNEKLFDEAATDLLKFVKRDLRGRIVRRYLFYLTLALLPFFVLLSLHLFSSSYFSWERYVGYAALAFTTLSFSLLWTQWPIVAFLKYEYGKFYHNALLGSLAPDGKPTLVILATNLTNGHLAYFNSLGVALDVTSGTPKVISHDRLPVALAVAASSAFPPMFSPVAVSRRLLKADADDVPNTQYLSDGGIYDNLGIRAAAWHDNKTKDLVVSDAERRFDHVLNDSFWNVISRTSRSTVVLMKRVSTLDVNVHDGVCHKVIRLQDDIGTDNTAFLAPNIQRGIRNIRTDLNRFSPMEIQLLFFKGYGAARKKFEGLDSKMPEISFGKNGVPLTATPPIWLPSAPTDPGMAADAESALLKGSKPGIRPFRGFGLLSVLLICMSCFFIFGHRYYREIRCVPSSLKCPIHRAASEAGSKIIDEHFWIEPYLRAFTASEDCKVKVQGLALSDPVGNRTYGRHPAAFTFTVKPRHGIVVADGVAFLLEVDGSFKPLEGKPDASGQFIVTVKQCKQGDRVLAVFDLCDKDVNSVLARSGSLTEVVDVFTGE